MPSTADRADIFPPTDWRTVTRLRILYLIGCEVPSTVPLQANFAWPFGWWGVCGRWCPEKRLQSGSDSSEGEWSMELVSKKQMDLNLAILYCNMFILYTWNDTYTNKIYTSKLERFHPAKGWHDLGSIPHRMVHIKLHLNFLHCTRTLCTCILHVDTELYRYTEHVHCRVWVMAWNSRK